MVASDPPGPEINAASRASMVVTESDLASSTDLLPKNAVIDTKYPAVFATARLVALMELAAAQLLVPFLTPGHLSAGVSIDVSHSAPTPLGAEVVAEATFLGKMDGKGARGTGNLFEFEVVARDEGGEVGRARHVRAIVNVEKLEAVATKRTKRAKA